MTTYEQDPDVLQWGLDLLQGDQYSNHGYCGINVLDGDGYYGGGYSIEGNFVADCISIENDEIVTHFLHEEFSRLLVAGVPGLSHADEEHRQASVLARDWFGPPVRDFLSGSLMETASSCLFSTL